MSLGILFPGQGSQSVGMLAELADAFPQVKETYQQASDAIHYDLWKVVAHGPDTELNKTHITQPAMLAADVAVYRIWQLRGGITPAVMAGHSLGEYSALVCAGSLSLDDATRLVTARGHFMQEAVPEGVGAMAAILGLEDQQVIDVCQQAAQDEVVSAVNFNSPGQVVIAGNASAVDRAITLAKDAGARRAVLLPVSVPSHCALMLPAAERLAERLAQITVNEPSVLVINNVDVKTETDPDKIRDALKRQLFSPVRWVASIEMMASMGINAVIECGPGKVLAGLNKRINRDMVCQAIIDTASLEQALASLEGGSMI